MSYTEENIDMEKQAVYVKHYMSSPEAQRFVTICEDSLRLQHYFLLEKI